MIEITSNEQGFPATVMLLFFQQYKRDPLFFILSYVQIYLKFSIYSIHGPLTRNDAWNTADSILR